MNPINKPEISIVLPCYNESKNLPLIVERVAKFWPRYNFELIMVDNGSTDDTQKVLNTLKHEYADFLRVVQIQHNIGYGHGILTGLKSAKADILAYSHADIQTPPEDVFRGIDLLKSNGNDINTTFLKGLRSKANRKPQEIFLTESLAKFVETVLGYRLEDINGQPKIFSKKLLNALKEPPVDFTFDTYLMYVNRIQGKKLETFPVEFGTRIHGASKWAGSVLSKYKTILKYIKNIVKIAKVHYDEPKNLLRQATRFLMTGIVTNVVNYATFFVLLRAFNIYYVSSSVAGFMTGFVTGFFINRHWTFGAQSGSQSKQLFKFFIVNMVSLGMNVMTIVFCTESLNIKPELSQLIAIGVSTVINFVGSKIWVFKT